MTELSLAAAFLVGLLGGVHCAGMCGGIVGALALNAPPAAPRLPFHLAYNGGRIASYTLAGLAAGALGAGSALIGGSLPVRDALFLLANLVLVALGLHLLGLTRAVLALEGAGGVLWKRLAPLNRRLLPLDSPAKALLLGGLWGWLPCGMVYTALVAALASGSALAGGGIMLAFGLGTLPNLLVLGIAAGRFQSLLQHPAARNGAGVLILGFGVWGLLRADALGVALGLAALCRVPSFQ